MKRLAFTALAATALAGCYIKKPVTAVTLKAEVRIEYDRPRPDLTIVTEKHETIVIPQVRRLHAVILEASGDSVTVLVLAIEPSHPRAYHGTTTLPGPNAEPAGQRWTRQQFSPGRTAALVLGPPVILLGLLILLIAAASPSMGG